MQNPSEFSLIQPINHMNINENTKWLNEDLYIYTGDQIWIK